MLGKLPVPGRPTILITVRQGPIALAVGAGGGYLDIFTLIYPSSSLSPSLWETARYRLKYCLKGPLNPKQPTNSTRSNCNRYRTKSVCYRKYEFSLSVPWVGYVLDLVPSSMFFYDRSKQTREFHSHNHIYVRHKNNTRHDLEVIHVYLC